ncbi:MAG: nickel pincer cofactor biosynthesis protein LarB [Endomicrobiales bacterium]|nr:nickel pincer cofactor biosynthesis protein LarB [Endomicrobiales bacterium]
MNRIIVHRENNADHGRFKRQGFPEAVYAPGKPAKTVISICRKLAVSEGPVIVTRAERALFGSVKRAFPKAVYFERAKIVLVKAMKKKAISSGYVCVITAGTTDVPVAEEAAVTAEALGAKVRRIYDVGVAGVHRLLEHKDAISAAKCVVVCAGMEGALGSVVGGMAACPVIGVPTSVGYGVSFGGVSALLSMLNSCAANVSVVNIDDGFGAGVIASLILKGSKR